MVVVCPFQALLELESSASSDEAVRERIASLPPEVSEIQLLSKLEGKPIVFCGVNNSWVKLILFLALLDWNRLMYMYESYLSFYRGKIGQLGDLLGACLLSI